MADAKCEHPEFIGHPAICVSCGKRALDIVDRLTAERDAAVTVVEAVHEYLSHAPGHMTRILFAALAAYDAAKRGT